MNDLDENIDVPWVCARLSESVTLQAEPDGLWLRGVTVGEQSGVETPPQPNAHLGFHLFNTVNQIVQLGLARIEGEGLCIAYADLDEISQQGIDFFETIAPYSPLLLKIETRGVLGWPNFRYYYEFYSGREPVAVARLGCFVRWRSRLYRLDRQSFLLVQAIDEHNRAQESSLTKSLLRFAGIKGLAKEVGAQIDNHIQSQQLIVPGQIGLDLLLDKDGAISFAPIIEGVEKEPLQRAFLQRDDVHETIAIDTPNGTVFVVLNDEQREVVRRMQKVRHLRGQEKASALSNPTKVFDGVASNIDLSGFGPRVRAIGDFAFAAQPFYRQGPTGVLDGLAPIGTPRRDEMGIQISRIDGTREEIRFRDRAELLAFYGEAKRAYLQGEGTVNLAGKTFQLDGIFMGGLDELVDEVGKPQRKSSTPAHRRYLLIYTNEDQVEYQESQLGNNQEIDGTVELPQSLVDPQLLKPHQIRGVDWLQTNLRLGRRGCLLADDMGLGKTLQVLAFLAWYIEKAQTSKEGETPCIDGPILVVAPLILLENETWIGDMKRFFASDGNVFRPWITLRRTELNRMKTQQGRETELADASLDLNELSKYRLILTNYETLVNYQYSFAKIPSGWAVVVTDEAQEYKTPSTKISHALKSLNARFRIASTGTPVETRLLDLWNLFDFLQPGGPLGSAQEFRKEYELEIERAPEKLPLTLEKLRGRLGYGMPKAHVLRREKRYHLPGLPEKFEHELQCELSDEQRSLHVGSLSAYGAKTRNIHPFSLLGDLMKIYQHPALVPSSGAFQVPDPSEALRTCPKLRSVISQIDRIRSVNEKVLVFTRNLHMQSILKRAFQAAFGLNVDILNGSVSPERETRSAGNTRSALIDRFRNAAGFNVLILSPDVAGVGLTLTAANHVIHYGRWWNPAREAQATDRVYRIGQTRPVHVYFPIARDPVGEFVSFDEKLDILIRKRRALADDFLAPMPSEDDYQRELLSTLLGDKAVTNRLSRGTESPVDLLALTWDQFEACVATMYEQEGALALLTPRTNDGGVDVLALFDDHLKVIQCKHSSNGAPIDSQALDETINAVDMLRFEFKDVLQDLPIAAVLATTGEVMPNTLTTATIKSVEVLDREALKARLLRCGTTHHHWRAMEARRLGSRMALRAALSDMIRKRVR